MAYFPPPPSPDFHGFSPDTVIPGQQVIETEGEGAEEQMVGVWKGGSYREDNSARKHLNLLTADVREL